MDTTEPGQKNDKNAYKSECEDDVYVPKLSMGCLALDRFQSHFGIRYVINSVINSVISQ